MIHLKESVCKSNILRLESVGFLVDYVQCTTLKQKADALGAKVKIE
jgi:hypothetical protein